MSGELRRVEAGRAQVVLGGIRDLWGFLDVGRPRRASLPLDKLLLGPSHRVGKTYAMLIDGPESAADAPLAVPGTGG